MSYGTSGRARLMNQLPLCQRFTSVAERAVARVHGDETSEWLMTQVESFGITMLDRPGMSGWDADGREVMSASSAMVAP